MPPGGLEEAFTAVGEASWQSRWQIAQSADAFEIGDIADQKAHFVALLAGLRTATQDLHQLETYLEDGADRDGADRDDSAARVFDASLTTADPSRAVADRDARPEANKDFDLAAGPITAQLTAGEGAQPLVQPVAVAGSDADTRSVDAPALDGVVENAFALNGAFWGRFLTNIENAINRIDQLTTVIESILERPGVPAGTERFFENMLELFDNTLARIDNLLDLVDRRAPADYDEWIGAIRDRVAEERDEIELIQNPPAPVDVVPEPDAPADQPPEDPAPEPERDWTAADFDGEGKTVVVIDSGWNTEFLGADERPVDQFDFFSNDGSAQVSHSNDHGSWVDQVVRGVADGLDIIHLKVFPDTSGGAPFSVIEDALDWVIDAVRADSYDISAVNLSLGAGNVQQQVTTGLSDEFAELDDLGVFSIVAAGNSGQDGVQILAADANTIAVSASTKSGNIAGFSQHDENLTDIFALGQSVRIEREAGGANSVSGTSFAAPYVSGVAARLQQAADELIDRSITDEEFVEILQRSGDDLTGFAGSNDPGGYHIADADAALTYFIENYHDFV